MRLLKILNACFIAVAAMSLGSSAQTPTNARMLFEGARFALLSSTSIAGDDEDLIAVMDLFRLRRPG